MKRLVFLVEGDPEELSNFSGIPYYFTRALRGSLATASLEVLIVNTDYLLNVEELLICIDHIREGHTAHEELPLGTTPAARQRKLRFTPNEKLLCQVAIHDDALFVAALKHYYAEIAKHMEDRLGELLRPGDVILSQNHFYPYIGERPIYYYLDTSLVDFYFGERFGTVARHWRGGCVEAYYRDMEREALALAPAIFCFSGALRKDLHTKYDIPSHRLVVAGAGVNLSPFPELIDRKPSERFKLLFVGLDFTRKGGQVLLEAMVRLKKYPVQLTIVTCTRDAVGFSVPENVEMSPPVGKRKLDEFYRAADAFVFPTLSEPFGLVNCEAMSYSLPVISSRLFAVPEILGSDEWFLLTQPGDASGLAVAIVHLMQRPELRQTVSKHNYLRAQRLFRWDLAADLIVERCLLDTLKEGAVGWR